MGACISKEDVAAQKKRQQKGDLKVPEFFYLNRLNKKILQLHPDAKINKIQIPNPFDLHTESAIGYLSKTRIMLAGGTDSTSCLTNDAFIIDIDGMRLYNICGLPIPAKEGTLIEHNGFVYYTGGLIEAEDEAYYLNEEPAPLMRYSIKNNSWEYLEISEKNGEVTLFIPKKVMEKEDEGKISPKYDKNFPLSDIILPGVFLYGKKIFFIGGHSVNIHGKIKMNKNVYSLNLDSLEFVKENFKLAIKAAKPACGIDGDKVIIAGGHDPNTGKSNSQVYVVNIAEADIGSKNLEPLSFELSEGYPAIISTSSPIFISFPKFAFWNVKKECWESYDIGITKKDPKMSKKAKRKSLKISSLDTEDSEPKSQKSTNSFEANKSEKEEESENSSEIKDKDSIDSAAQEEKPVKIKSPKIEAPEIEEESHSFSNDKSQSIKAPPQAPIRLPPGKVDIVARQLMADLKLGSKILPILNKHSEKKYKENIINLNPKLRRPKIHLEEYSDISSSEEEQEPKIRKKISSSVLLKEKQENSSSSLTDDKSELIIDPNGDISPIQVKKIISQNGKANTEFKLSLKSAWS
ncbi:unnamed protein product [Blepharisma stoltei]|uniref:Uncharacterized protein n=1 Tax=Blepharisma stoltei TaxID=1481888 RepID=A0AAU9IH14_9CILI|nr:unnamed protein product [Blepharisma stoltei]